MAQSLPTQFQGRAAASALWREDEVSTGGPGKNGAGKSEQAEKVGAMK